VSSPVYIVIHRPGEVMPNTGVFPLIHSVDATPIWHGCYWRNVQKKSWSWGHLLRQLGNTYYGNMYNWLIPLYDEVRIAYYMRNSPKGICHFLWSDFCSPSISGLFKKHVTIGTYHSTPHRLRRVVKYPSRLKLYERIILMSESQRDFFADHGYEDARLQVILHGVDTQYFKPGNERGLEEGPLRCLLVGSTERDHCFMAEVLRRISEKCIHLYLRTSAEQVGQYAGLRNVQILDRLDAHELKRVYQQADLLVLPLNDCTANNAILESMACGTPVLVNRVGGIPEYVTTTSNYVMEGKNIDEWVDLITYLYHHKEELNMKRLGVRKWVEQFDWKIIANQYQYLYRSALGEDI